MIDRLRHRATQITQDRARNGDDPIRRREHSAEHSIASSCRANHLVQRYQSLRRMNRACTLVEKSIGAGRDVHEIGLEITLDCPHPLNNLLHRFEIATRKRSSKLKAMHFDPVEVHEVGKSRRLMRGCNYELMTFALEGCQQ